MKRLRAQVLRNNCAPGSICHGAVLRFSSATTNLFFCCFVTFHVSKPIINKRDRIHICCNYYAHRTSDCYAYRRFSLQTVFWVNLWRPSGFACRRNDEGPRRWARWREKECVYVEDASVFWRAWVFAWENVRKPRINRNEKKITIYCDEYIWTRVQRMFK